MKSALRQASSRMRSSSGRSPYLFGSAISHYNFDPDFLRPRVFVGLRFVDVAASWVLHCPAASPKRKNLDNKRTQMHRCYGLLGAMACPEATPIPLRSKRICAIGAGRIAFLAPIGGSVSKQVIRLSYPFPSMWSTDWAAEYSHCERALELACPHSSWSTGTGTMVRPGRRSSSI